MKDHRKSYQIIYKLYHDVSQSHDYRHFEPGFIGNDLSLSEKLVAWTNEFASMMLKLYICFRHQNIDLDDGVLKE